MWNQIIKQDITEIAESLTRLSAVLYYDRTYEKFINCLESILYVSYVLYVSKTKFYVYDKFYM
jgi:hypothetical protein